MSSATPTPADVFEGLWRQLRECHQNALEELEAKVSKLKKERCLDAQRLQLFYTRNQQLKEQNKTLQDAISLLEERLRERECDRCALLEENLKNNQDENLRQITKLMNERNRLEDENTKLLTELQKFKMSRSELEQASSPEQEGIIPDSPVLASSLPAANKLKKRRNNDKIQRVRYAEMPLPQLNNSVFNVLNKEPATKNPGRAEVLVPNTCELDTSQIPNDVNLNPAEVVAETCRLEPHDKGMKMTAGQKSSSSPRKYDFCLKPHRSSCLSTLIHSPDSTTETSPSLLPRLRRFPENSSINKAKRKKEETDPEEQQEDKQDKQKDSKQPELIKETSTSLNTQSSKKDQLESLVRLTQNGTLSRGPSGSCTSPAFKKPNFKRETHMDTAYRRHHVEPTWSIDPALALSMYEDEQREEQQCPGEVADTDCTWVSHSLLQARGEETPDRSDRASGLGKKANDSLDLMFDTTAYGEYNSCNSPHLGQSQPCEDEDEENEQDPPENNMSPRRERKAQHPTFAHVAVVRKKDERRKLKGTTCKECEDYYVHLPEEERQKKLSACSRHRFLYIPPCTPENFWEVGFPSTQTCIERGYIKEETNPQTRSRRRQPFNALFSPKRNQQES